MARLAPKTMLLFYDGYELKAVPGVFGALYSKVRGIARDLYRTLRGKQAHTGFYTAFIGLQKSLRANGWTVRVNDFRLARANPAVPIGIAGYPSVLDRIDLPNPAIFGPGDYGVDESGRKAAADPRLRVLIQPSDWAVEFNRPWAGHKSATWFAGIDTADWPDLSDRAKPVDVLIYDKIRWRRETQVPAVRERLQRHLAARGRSFEILRYGHHHLSAFRAALSRCACFAFLCEHETQGLAYQEAMSSGLPVFAWDEGVLVDPLIKDLASPHLAVSAVPYFDSRCGRTFRLASMESEFDAFWAARNTFAARAYVEDVLSLEASGALYLQLLDRARGD